MKNIEKTDELLPLIEEITKTVSGSKHRESE